MKYLFILSVLLWHYAYAGDQVPRETPVQNVTLIENTYISYQNSHLDGIAAMSAALSAIPDISHASHHHEDAHGNHTALGIGAGQYGDKSAVSAALIHHAGDNAVKATIAASQGNKSMFGVGLTIGF